MGKPAFVTILLMLHIQSIPKVFNDVGIITCVMLKKIQQLSLVGAIVGIAITGYALFMTMIVSTFSYQGVGIFGSVIACVSAAICVITVFIPERR